MDITVKTGCTVFYKQKFYEQKFFEQNHYAQRAASKKRSRFTSSHFLSGKERVQLVWIFVKVIPVILFA